jgi:glycosyltransferase involved in cell wall biosynthesis
VKLLVVNWQDRTNPHAGGAEVHLHEIFGRLVQKGHEVTVLCSGYDGAAQTAVLDGMEIHRTGSRYSFPLHVRRYWSRVLKPRNFDIVIEDLNKVPVWTPHWGARQVVGLVHHLFGATAFREVSAPLAAVTVAAEWTIPFIYRGVPFQAVSQSTKDDLIRRGLNGHRIEVIHQGVDTAFFTPDAASRGSRPIFGYVGRLKQYKQVELILEAFARMGHPEAHLEIAGAGDWRPRLEARAASLALGGRVRFLGFISEEEKRALLRRAWAVALTSPKEGWGITNVEAAACGTPVVASDSPGLRESVVDRETGFLVPHGDVAALTSIFQQLAGDPALVATLGARGRAFAERLTWERAADHTEAHLLSVVRNGG